MHDDDAWIKKSYSDLAMTGPCNWPQSDRLESTVRFTLPLSLDRLSRANSVSLERSILVFLVCHVSTDATWRDSLCKSLASPREFA